MSGKTKRATFFTGCSSIPARSNFFVYAAGDLPRDRFVLRDRGIDMARHHALAHISGNCSLVFIRRNYHGRIVVISGIELVEKIKKGQYKFGKLGGGTATMPALWQAALAA